jgi:hypothetical protein
MDDEYPDILKFTEVEGQKVAFPKDIEEALEKAQIFSTHDQRETKLR